MRKKWNFKKQFFGINENYGCKIAYKKIKSLMNCKCFF